MSIPTGTRVDRYIVESAIGAGSMGDVLRASDVDLHRKVAIKILSEKHRDNPELQGRFSREGRAVAAISHPNVVQVFSTGQHDGRPYIAMEFLDGVDLQTEVRQHGAMSAQRATEVTAQVARGLQAAAQAGLIHRDVKPSNIVLLESGVIKVTDFGLAKPKDPRNEPALTALGVVVGTPDYIAPEQARGEKLDERVDIYALGGTFYFLVTGVPPYRKGNAQDDKYLKVVARHLRDPAPDPRVRKPEIDVELANTIMQMMGKAPGDRPGYDELIRRLEAMARRLSQSPSGDGYVGKKHPSQATPTPFVGGMRRPTRPGTKPPDKASSTLVNTPTAERQAPPRPPTDPGPTNRLPSTPVPYTPVPNTPLPHSPAPYTPAPNTPTPNTPTPYTPTPYTPAPNTPAPRAPAPHTSPPRTTGPMPGQRATGPIPTARPGAVTMRSEPGDRRSPLAAPITRPPEMPAQDRVGMLRASQALPAQGNPRPRKSRALLVFTVFSALVLAVGIVLRFAGSGAAESTAKGRTIDAGLPDAPPPPPDAAPALPEPPKGMVLVSSDDGSPWFFVASAPVTPGEYKAVFPRQKIGGSNKTGATRVSNKFAMSYAETKGARLASREELVAARAAGAISAGGLSEWTSDVAKRRPIAISPSGKNVSRRDRGYADLTFRLVQDLPKSSEAPKKTK